VVVAAGIITAENAEVAEKESQIQTSRAEQSQNIKREQRPSGGGFGYARKVGNAEMETVMDSNKTHWNKMR
jgi:hypothetical protein